MPIAPPTSNRKTSLPYYRLRADASQTFSGLDVKSLRRSTRYGVIAGEPIAIPRQSPEIIVSWFQSPPTQISLQRLELTGGSRVRRAMPTLSEMQRLFVCQVVDFDDRRNWGRLDVLSDRWLSLRTQPVPQVQCPLIEAADAIDDAALSLAQKITIATIHQSLNPDITPIAIGLHWLELGRVEVQ